MEAAQLKTLRQRRSKQEVKDLLIAFEKSNSTIKEFCEDQNLSYGVFQKWRSRHGSSARRKRTLTAQEFTKTEKPGFADVRIIPSSAALFAEVNGIKIFQPVAASYLKELLQ